MYLLSPFPKHKKHINNLILRCLKNKYRYVSLSIFFSDMHQ